MIAILGTGKMGEALLSGLLKAGRPAAEVAAVVRRPARAEELRAAYGIAVLTAAEAAEKAETLVLSVKPQDMGRMLDEIAGLVAPSQLVISIAAGITTSFIERRFTAEVPVVRVMSNTPALVDEAMSVISAGSFAGEEHLRHAEELFTPLGKVIRIPEYLQDAATALSGSGPAYVFYLVEAMVDAAHPARHAAPDGAGHGDADRVRRGDDAARQGRAPGHLAGCGDVPGRHDDRGDPRA